MSRRRLSVLALAAYAFGPAVAAAQTLTQPRRAADTVAQPAPTGNRPEQSLTVAVDLLAGYDDNALPSGQNADPDAPAVFTQPSYTGLFGGSLEYQRRSGDHTVSLSGRGSFATYDEESGSSSASSPGAAPTAGLLAGYATRLGRGNTLSISEALTLESLYSLGAFDALAGEVPPGELPIGGPGQGVTERRSVSSNTGVAFGRRLGRRDTVDVNYAYVTRAFSGDELGGGGASHSAGLAYARALNRTTGLNVTYGYSNGEYSPISGGGGDRPLVGHTIDAGVRYLRRISARRALQIAGGFGATRTTGVSGIEETPYSAWTPSGHVSAQIDLVRTWAIVGNYRREVSSLDGLTGEAYVANTYGVSVGGSVGPRTTLAVAAGYGSGGVPTAATVTSEYTNTTASAQLSVRLLRNLSAIVQGSLYRYDISGDAAVPSGFPPGYDRSSIRVGVSWRQPIIAPRTR